MSKEFGNQPQPSKRPEQTQPLQGRAVGRESLQGPTTVDGSAHGRSENTSVQEHLDGHEQDAIVRHGNKGKAHSPEHRAKISEGLRRSRQSRSPLTPEERREKKRKYVRDYQKNNKDKVNAYQRRYRSGDPSIGTNQKLIEYQRQRYWERVAKEEEESANDPSTDFAQIEQRLREALQTIESPHQKK